MILGGSWGLMLFLICRFFPRPPNRQIKNPAKFSRDTVLSKLSLLTVQYINYMYTRAEHAICLMSSKRFRLISVPSRSIVQG